MVAPGQEARPRRRAQRGRVPLRVGQAVVGEPLQRRHLDPAAVRRPRGAARCRRRARRARSARPRAPCRRRNASQSCRRVPDVEVDGAAERSGHAAVIARARRRAASPAAGDSGARACSRLRLRARRTSSRSSPAPSSIDSTITTISGVCQEPISQLTSTLSRLMTAKTAAMPPTTAATATRALPAFVGLVLGPLGGGAFLGPLIPASLRAQRAVGGSRPNAANSAS